MRTIIVLLVALSSLSAHAQINGAFSRDGEVYSFRKNGTFDWIQTTATEITYGNGTYKINGKSIELSFERARLQPDIQLNESTPTTNTRSTVEVRIMFSNGRPVQRAKVTLVQSNIVNETNLEGISQIEVPDPPVNDKVEIELNGHRSAGIPITLKGNNALLGIVIDETTRYKDNQTEQLSFKNKRRKIKLNGMTFKKM